MKCFELRDDAYVRGLAIDEAEGSPRVNVTESGDLYLPLGADPSSFFLRQAEPLKPYVRMTDVVIADGLLQAAPRNDRMALVRIDVAAGRGGTVTLTSGAYEDLLHEKEGEVKKGFRQFPPVGVSLLSEEDPTDVAPWVVGSERLELMVTMVHGSCFRVHRTGNLRGLLRDLFVEWHAFEGPKLRPSKKWSDNNKEKSTPQRRETLLPPVMGLA